MRDRNKVQLLRDSHADMRPHLCAYGLPAMRQAFFMRKRGAAFGKKEEIV